MMQSLLDDYVGSFYGPVNDPVIATFSGSVCIH